jgi:hypothetical protein
MNRTPKKFFLSLYSDVQRGSFFVLYCFVCALMSAKSQAQDRVSYSIEPTVSYALQRKTEPSAHSRMVLLYGARATAGYRVFAGEFEYLQGESNETFPELVLNVLERTHQLRAGLRSGYSFSKGVSSSVRAGAQVSQRTRTRTQAGASQTSTVPTRVDPYLGGGIGVELVSVVEITLEGLATFRNLKNFSENEYSVSLGARFTMGRSP